MSPWLTELMQPDRLLTVAFILFILFLMGKSLFKVFPFVASFVGLVQTLVGDDAKGQPGIGARMVKQGEKMSELTDLVRGQGDELEKVRAQVQNSHSTNLRDDVDRVKVAVDKVAEKLDEHIDIAKKYDAAQDETAKQVEKLVETLADKD